MDPILTRHSLSQTMADLSFSHGGTVFIRYLLTGSDDKSAKLWDVSRRKFVLSLSGHANWVRAVAPSPEGRLCLSASDDKTVRVGEEENCGHAVKAQCGS